MYYRHFGFFNLLILTLFLLASDSHAQLTDSASSIKSDDTVFVMQKSPWRAVGLSAVLPGAGQFYNQSYWKIPVVWGTIGYFLYYYFYNDNLYKDNADRYTKTGQENYKRIREFYHDQRDEFGVYLGLTYFLNVVDAYVDAHLFDFSVKESPSLNSHQIQIRYFF